MTDGNVFLRLADGPFGREYEVIEEPARLLGIVTKWDGLDGHKWAANCVPDGCGCHGFYRTRRDAIEALK